MSSERIPNLADKREDHLLVAAVVDEHRYVIYYTPSTKDAAICQLGKWADDDRFNFNWCMATACGDRIERQVAYARANPKSSNMEVDN